MLAAIVFAAVGQDASTAQDLANRDLQLAVFVNGHSIERIGAFHERDKKLSVTRREWAALGFKPPGEERASTGGADAELSLDALPGISWRIDERTQTIYLTASATAMLPTLLAAAGGNGVGDLPISSGWGAVLNYDVIGNRTAATTVGEALLDGRIFTPYGVAATSGTVLSQANAPTRQALRLDSTYTYSDPDAVRRGRVGDVISGGLAWSRPVRLAGAQVTTDFSIRPDLVTMAVPTIAGQVAVPSSVDILVNGVQMLSRDVQPGPFEIRQLPIVTGAGDVSVVVHDAAGNQTLRTLPIYASSLLLAPGLSSFSAELGALRLNYGAISDDYHALAGVASYRYGMFDWMTLEGHAEGAARAVAFSGLHTPAGGLAGGGASLLLWHLGAISLDGAISNFAGRNGGLGYLSFERNTQRLSLSGSIQVSSRSFRDIAAAYGDPVPRLQTHGSVGLSLGTWGSLGIAYVGLRRSANTVTQQFPGSFSQEPLQAGSGFNLPSLIPATRVSLLSATYSRPVLNRRAYFYATAFHDLANKSSFGLMAGLTMPFGTRTSAGVSASTAGRGQNYGTVQVGQAVIKPGDAGYQALASIGTPSRQMVEGDYKSPWGTLSLAADREESLTSVRATAQGALAYADGGLFAANTIYDSFAVVDTTETPGIEVLQENRPVGQTGSSGLLLVPDLRSYDANRLGIAPTDVPIDVDIGETSRMVRPQDRSGVVVTFPVRQSHGAVLLLVDAVGAPIPAGSTASLVGKDRKGPLAVGYGGEVYATGLQPHDSIVVTRTGGGQCQAAFDYAPVAGTLPQIGPLTCRAALP